MTPPEAPAPGSTHPRYPEYKDSGVEWLNKVPEHWKVGSLKYAGRLQGGAGFPHSEQGDTDSEFPFYKVNSLAKADPLGYLTTTADSVSQEVADRLRACIFPTDTIVFAKVGAALLLSRIRRLPHNACFDNNMMGIVPKEDAICSSYLYYSMQQIRFDLICNPGAVPSLNEKQIGSYLIAFPPLPEQRAIAGFLDRETRKIDGLVAEQRRLIGLLKEKRQAVISHAVTRGLPRKDGSQAPTKPSGIEWLGDVPEHWDVKPFRSIANIVRGASPRPAGDSRYFNGDFMPWVTVGEITKDSRKELDGTDTYLTSEGAQISRTFEPGTLIYSNSGATLGVPKILKITACANDGVVGFLRLDSRVSSSFLYYFLTSTTEAIREEVKQGSGQPNLNTDIVKAMRFALPSVDEQIEIVEILESKLDEFAVLMQQAESTITLLQERRSALISAAVTGKIDVRPPELRLES